LVGKTGCLFSQKPENISRVQVRAISLSLTLIINVTLVFKMSGSKAGVLSFVLKKKILELLISI